MKRLIIFGVLAALLAANTGCGLLSAIFCYRPRVGCGDCTPAFAGEGCDEGCGPTCGPMRRPIRAPAYAARRPRTDADCSPCGDPCADPCGQGCYGRCWHRGPLSCVFALLMHGSWWGPSCGERYWGDFYNDPPDCWDPCDDHGNYTGGGCRNCGGYGGGDGYSRSPAGSRTDDGVPVPGDNVVSQTDRTVVPAPKPAAQPHKAVKQ